MRAQLDEAVTGAAGGGQPVHTGRSASISGTSSDSAGPTVTVRDTGSMSST